MIKLDKVSKTFATGSIAISDVTLSVDKGEFVFLIGPTGSGKTTLFRLLIREFLPSKGSIIVADFDVVKLPGHKIPNLRKKVGVIFQDLKLLLDRTIFENIVLPLEVVGMSSKDAIKRVEEVMEDVEITEHRDKFPIQLSGGELQRVAIARSLVLSPEILLADEPTGNLDSKSGFEIMNIFKKLNKTGKTIIMITHETDIAKNAKRIIRIKDGEIV